MFDLVFGGKKVDLSFFGRTPAGSQRQPIEPVADEKVLAVYAALAQKRATYDLMLWQAPMISLTAQAFLLQIVLADENSYFHRVLAGIAAFGIGLASRQLFLRHATMEKKASEMLQELENKYSLETAHGDLCPGQKSKDIWSWCLLLISLLGLEPICEAVFKSMLGGF